MTVDVAREAIWLPGVGEISLRERQVAQAIQEYDSELVLGYNKENRDWIVFLRSGHDGQPQPVLGLGPELPPADQVKAKLYQHDVRRNGREIVKKMQQRMAQGEAEAKHRYSEQTGQAAEVMEWAHRKMGSHPSPRIFVPGK